MTTSLPNRIDRLEALAETTLLAIQQQQTAITDLRTGIARLRERVSLLSAQIRGKRNS
ncbi:MAG: hypothetical protein LH679_22805 [Cyanobacteria bacterium CAN_BIN43]|nr:hypothetical protein [Cyanobacteria bacterium CAN_BIN43]